MIRVHNQINGRWLQYWCTKRNLERLQIASKERINFYDYNKIEDPYISGFIPSEKEWQLENPNYKANELLSIVAVNSKSQFLRVSLIKSKEVAGRVIEEVKLSLRLNENQVYSIEEQYFLPVSEIKKNEYKAGALCVEVLNPFRKLRIKFRGYLKNEINGDIIFAQLRLHWYALSNVFDHKCNFDSKFIATQLVGNESEKLYVEDRMQQFGNIKGTVNIESEAEQQLFLWGLRSKSIVDNCFRASRLIGVSKNGVAVDIGCVTNEEDKYSYSYGVIANNKLIDGITYADNNFSNVCSNMFQGQLRTKNGIFNLTIEAETNLPTRNGSIDESEAKFLFFEEKFNETNESFSLRNQINVAYSVSDVKEECGDLVLSLENIRAQSVNISGGKGSSLVALTRLSEISNHFKVPKGIVVTANAYNLLLNQSPEILEKVQQLEKLTWSHSDTLKAECLKTQEIISNTKIPEIVKTEIENHLKDNFGNSLDSTRFAIRSSAIGEDSEEMSGAGQLSTFLGIKGIDEIMKAVMKCWASQFNYNYIEYKRGYGQLINNGMAVIILEMVDCDTAGVIFTCDPLNGDERTIVITANYGLGESVVSASSEPDTVRVKIGVKSNDLNVKRTVEGIEKVDIGKKEKYIKMDERGGTVELDVDNRKECCVSKDDLLRLAEVSLNIHAYYGNPRDIEWGIKDGIIYLLQSRPVTNLDSYNEWELMHDLDSGYQQEKIFYSRVHWNENFPGASSPLCISFIIKMLDKSFQNFMAGMSGNTKRNRNYFSPYIYRPLPGFYSQVFFNFREFAISLGQSKNENRAFMGSDIDDDEMTAELMPIAKKMMPGFLTGIKLLGNLILCIIFVGRWVSRIEFRLKSRKWFPNKDTQTAEQLFAEITTSADELFTHAATTHTQCSTNAGVFTRIILNILTSSTENLDEAFSDFAKIQEANSGILSAEVPKLLCDIANAVDDKNMFSQMTDEEALKYLQSGDNEASKKFKSFLDRHGYRGIKEMDPYVLQWGDEPIKLIPIIKNVSQNLKESNTKVLSVGELISSLKTKPSFFKRLLLRLCIPLSFRGTRIRERSKSMLVYYTSKYRTAFYSLAHKLSVEEGKLPEKELLFFLTLSEIEQLIKERSPTLVVKAKQRKRIHSKLDKLQFQTIVKDWEFTPLNFEKRIDSSTLNGAVRIKGTAVTSLVIKGRAFVAPSLEDAKNIQNGDILITYTTDIGWSPYFPLVSGVVTEMGGLNSHGAVIAREFGLPCIIGAINACELFRSGDTVLVDGEKGTIVKLQETT